MPIEAKGLGEEIIFALGDPNDMTGGHSGREQASHCSQPIPTHTGRQGANSA